MLHLDETHLPLGALAWAACGKDPGFTPEFLLEHAARHVAYRQDDLDRLSLREPLALGDLKRRWLGALERARTLAARLPPDEIGCLYVDDDRRPVAPEQRGIDPGTGETGSYNNFWVERGVRMARTSLIVDPPEGRLPPLTPAEAQRRPGREAYRSREPAGPEDRNLYERCISRGLPGAMMPGFYNHNYQIFQTPGYVVIFVEMIHDARIVPLDGRPHADGGSASGWGIRAADGRATPWSSRPPTSSP